MTKRRRSGDVDALRLEFDSLVGQNALAELKEARRLREGGLIEKPLTAAEKTSVHDPVPPLLPPTEVRDQISVPGAQSVIKPDISQSMFPKAYMFEFFDVDAEMTNVDTASDISGYIVCGDWIPEGSVEKQFGVTIYFRKVKDAERAEALLQDMGLGGLD